MSDNLALKDKIIMAAVRAAAALSATAERVVA